MPRSTLHTTTRSARQCSSKKKWERSRTFRQKWGQNSHVPKKRKKRNGRATLITKTLKTLQELLADQTTSSTINTWTITATRRNSRSYPSTPLAFQTLGTRPSRPWIPMLPLSASARLNSPGDHTSLITLRLNHSSQFKWEIRNSRPRPRSRHSTRSWLDRSLRWMTTVRTCREARPLRLKTGRISRPTWRSRGSHATTGWKPGLADLVRIVLTSTQINNKTNKALFNNRKKRRTELLSADPSTITSTALTAALAPSDTSIRSLRNCLDITTLSSCTASRAYTSTASTSKPSLTSLIQVSTSSRYSSTSTMPIQTTTGGPDTPWTSRRTTPRRSRANRSFKRSRSRLRRLSRPARSTNQMIHIVRNIPTANPRRVRLTNRSRGHWPSWTLSRRAKESAASALI